MDSSAELLDNLGQSARPDDDDFLNLGTRVRNTQRWRYDIASELTKSLFDAITVHVADRLYQQVAEHNPSTNRDEFIEGMKKMVDRVVRRWGGAAVRGRAA